MKPARAWFLKLTITSFIFLVIPFGGVMAFNFYIDPLWNFTHSNEYNDFQQGFNERIQKTNWINAREGELDFDSLMIGTSRTTYINPSSFDEKVLHYGLSELHVTEYRDYMRYAQSKNSKPFDKIYMELTVRSFDTWVKPAFTEAQGFFDDSEKPFQRYTSLFSYDTFERAKFNYEISRDNYTDIYRAYDRDLNVFTDVEQEDMAARLIKLENQLKARDDYSKNWASFDKDYKMRLINMRNEFPDAEFVVFTDLALADRLKLTIEHPQYTDMYKRYVREVVEVFGKLYSFHGYNEVTTDWSKFFDVYHFYPEVGDRVAHDLQNGVDTDILTIVTEENMEQYFESLGI